MSGIDLSERQKARKMKKTPGKVLNAVIQPVITVLLFKDIA